MDIAVIVMGVIAVVAGIAGFIMERGGKDESEDTVKDTKQITYSNGNVT